MTIRHERPPMRYVRLTIDVAPAARHPVQEAVMASETITRERMVNWNVSDDEFDYYLFHVEGPMAEYERALDGVDSVVEYDLTPIGDGSFYAHVTERPRPTDEAFKSIFESAHLLLVPPVIYESDATIRMTVAGEHEDLEGLLAAMPEQFSATVEEVGEYDAPFASVTGRLTERQRQAVRAAVELGYYDVPRDGSVEAVAGRLDCAPSTASNHLRKAEAAIMAALVDAGRV